MTKALQSVRSMVKAGHLVVVGDGEDGSCHYIFKRMTTELNAVKGDRTNYLLGLYVVPQPESGFDLQVAVK